MGFINYKYNAIEVKYNPGIDPQKQLKAELKQPHSMLLDPR